MKNLFLCLILCLSTSVYGQQLKVTGTVIDEVQEPLIGAVISTDDPSNGTITDIDGNFSMSIAQGTTLYISYIGYITQAVVVDGDTPLRIALSKDAKLLDEVVVIGYGTVKRKDVTTSITSVNTKDIDTRPIVSAGQALQGKAAGVSVTQTNGAPGAELSIRVRGTTSFNGNNDPLYVVDGVPVDNIKFLSPNDIASLQVLKDASAAAIYGSRAANGVVLISTKSGNDGKSKVTFSAQYGVSDVANDFDVLNVDQYKELQDEIGIVNLPEGLTDVTDWQDVAFRTGISQNYQVGFSNGDDKLNYYLSAGYIDEKGVIETTYFKRYNFNGRWHNQVRDWLTLDAKVTYSDYTGNSVKTGAGANRGGVVLSVMNTPTYAPVMDPANPYQYNNQSTKVLDRWKIPGQITDVPKANFDLKNSSYFIEDGSYLRLKEITLSYNVTSPLLKKWGINKLQPYFTASNLYTWTSYSGIDPEVNQWGNSGAVQGIDWSTYPQSKTYLFGVNIEF